MGQESQQSAAEKVRRKPEAYRLSGACRCLGTRPGSPRYGDNCSVFVRNARVAPFVVILRSAATKNLRILAHTPGRRGMDHPNGRVGHGMAAQLPTAPLDSSLRSAPFRMTIVIGDGS